MKRKFFPYSISHRDELGNLLNELQLLGEGAEIGVCRGKYSCQLLKTWHGRLLHLVDPWRKLSDYRDGLNVSDRENEHRYQETLIRLKIFSERFRIHRKLSAEAVDAFSDKSLDFVYIDANHEYRHIRADLELWYPKIRSGGVFAGHDFIDGINVNGIFGVKTAVEEFVASKQLTFQVTEEEFPTWYIFL